MPLNEIRAIKAGKKPPNKYISRFSEKRAKENREYLKLREKFLKGKLCPITGKPATEVHHKAGRVGKNFLDQSTWLAVSREGHRWIEANVDASKKLGYSLNRIK